MARNKLSETRVKAIEAPGIYGDGDGLWLRVQKRGSKNWIFIYKRQGRRTEIGLGGYGQGTAPVSLALAREKAEAIRDQLARGIDPLAARKPARTITFEDCMEALLDVKKAEWRNDKHAAQWRMTLREYAKPLHQLPIADITVGDVEACLLPHWTERPETADRLRSRIQAVIDYAIAREWRTAGNPARWKGLLEKVMPKRLKLTRGHHIALPYKAAPATMARLRKSKGVAARAVEFLVLTAARSGEIRGAKWQEIDFDEKLWRIPADRMKGGVEHDVPLVGAAIAVLREMRDRSTGDFVFGGERDGSAISDTAMTKALRRAAGDDTVTIHGFRSTFRDWTGDCTSFPREIAEAALSHQVGSAVERSYRRGTALAKRRKLMEAWSKYCESAQ